MPVAKGDIVGGLWLWFLPLLFLPMLGLAPDTNYGTFELADLLMPFFLMLIFLGNKTYDSILSYRLYRPAFFFIAWSSISILLIYFRYDYPNPKGIMTFSALKLAKFVLYAYVGLSISRLLINSRVVNRYHFSLTIAAVISSIGLIIAYLIRDILPGRAYKAGNLMSVSLATMFVYLSILYFQRYGSSRFRLIQPYALLVILAGLTFSSGRGGIIAALVVLAIFLIRHKMTLRQILLGVLLVVGGFALYEINPRFQRDIQETFFRDEAYLQRYKAGVAGVDDGSRVSIWAHEAPKILYSPFIGTGFYHKGGRTHLYGSGSHNFWLQIFLETGIIGGLLLLYMINRMWKHGRIIERSDLSLGRAFRYALLCMFIGNLSGEYLYGGLGLLTLFIIYAPIGSWKIDRETNDIYASHDTAA